MDTATPGTPCDWESLLQSVLAENPNLRPDMIDHTITVLNAVGGIIQPGVEPLLAGANSCSAWTQRGQACRNQPAWPPDLGLHPYFAPGLGAVLNMARGYMQGPDEFWRAFTRLQYQYDHQRCARHTRAAYDDSGFTPLLDLQLQNTPQPHFANETAPQSVQQVTEPSMPLESRTLWSDQGRRPEGPISNQDYASSHSLDAASPDFTAAWAESAGSTSTWSLGYDPLQLDPFNAAYPAWTTTEPMDALTSNALISSSQAAHPVDDARSHVPHRLPPMDTSSQNFAPLQPDPFETGFQSNVPLQATPFDQAIQCRGLGDNPEPHGSFGDQSQSCNLLQLRIMMNRGGHRRNQSSASSRPRHRSAGGTHRRYHSSASDSRPMANAYFARDPTRRPHAFLHMPSG